jgi:hypothetical protein
MHVRKIALISLMISFVHVACAEPETNQPLLQKDGWIFTDQNAWEWNEDGAKTELILKQASKFIPKVRSPFNLAWFEQTHWGSFTFTADVRLDLFNNGNNDVCIAFGKESETKFYYAHLGEKADAVHLQLHLVNDSDRQAITAKRVEALPWEKGKWHKVKIERDLTQGSMSVWFDGEIVLSAIDKNLGKGTIGVGSFDDLCSFRNIVINPK